MHRLPQAAPFTHGTMVPLRGQPHRIVHRRGMRGTVWIEIGENGERSLCVAGEDADMSIAGCAISSSARPRAISKRRAGAPRRRSACRIKRVSVRDQSSRWGSCSTTGVLSYSWRLILAPSFVLDYLAAHEVAHLVEMNHSPRFWRLVDRICPKCARAKTWLDVHGTDLHRYGLPDNAAGSGRPAGQNGARLRLR